MDNLLIEEINKVIEIGNYKENQKKIKQNISDIDNMIREVKDLNTKVSICKNDFHNINKIVTTLDVDYNDLINKINSIIRNVEKNNFQIIELRVLAKNIIELSKQIENIWTNYKDEQLKSSEEIINIFKRVINDTDENRELCLLMLSLKKEGVATEEAINLIQKYKATFDVLIAKLDFSDNILNFMIKLSGGVDVTLSDVDIEIYNWIKDNKFDDKIKLKL